MLDFLGYILSPIEFVVSYIMYGIHEGLSVIFNNRSGLAWPISIILLTVLIRVCILPLFLKTIKSTRKMQALQPQMKAIQKKYKGKKDQASREAMSKETMALYQQHGANPFGSCLPLLIQSPFFLALYNMLRNIQPISQGEHDAIGPINTEIAQEFEGSSFFGLHLSDTFGTVQGGAIVAIVCMIAIMCGVMFCSQRLVMLKNMPQAAKEGPQYNVQKTMVYIFPVMYIFSGIVFPVGLLLYMMTTNLWTLGQGMWQLHFMPTPGSEAAENKEAREEAKKLAEKEKLKKENPEEYEKVYGVPDEKKQQRTQPKKKGKRK